MAAWDFELCVVHNRKHKNKYNRRNGDKGRWNVRLTAVSISCVPRFSSTADSIQQILPSLYPAASSIIAAVTYLSEQDVKIRVSVFGNFLFLGLHSAAN